jgi:hypothetical protein
MQSETIPTSYKDMVDRQAFEAESALVPVNIWP